MPELTTERLLLRRWREDDLEPFAALTADPEVMRYFPAPLDRAASDALAARADALFDTHGFGLWALELRATGEFIGFTGLAPMPDGVPGTGGVEVGWRLARAFWGAGYASEAARASVRFGFETAGLVEINSITAVTNTRSRAVMERIGMRQADFFDHPRVSLGSPLRPHVRYRIAAEQPGGAAEGRDDVFVLRRCVEADYRAIIEWVPDAAALYLFTGDRLSWPLTLEQLESLAATPRWTDWTLVAADAPLQPLGHVEVAFVDPATVRMSRVLVSPAQRGRGLGRILAALAVEKARALGATRVELAVIAGNEAAERTYDRLGFRPSGRAPKRPDVRELALDLQGPGQSADQGSRRVGPRKR